MLKGSRWENANNNVKDELKQYLDDFDLDNSVYVHGDITSENVLIDKNDNIFIIDFADSIYAPKQYEYPPIVFDLFDSDTIMLKEFFINKDKKEISDELFKGLLIHDFGGNIADIIVQRFADKKLADLTNLRELKSIIKFIVSR